MDRKAKTEIGVIILIVLLLAFFIFFKGFGLFSSISPLRENQVGGIGCYGQGLAGSFDEATPDGPNKILDYEITCSGTITFPNYCNYNLKKSDIIINQGGHLCTSFYSDISAGNNIINPSKILVYEDPVVALTYNGKTPSQSKWFLRIKESAFVPELIFNNYFIGSSTQQKVIYKITSNYNLPVQAFLVGQLKQTNIFTIGIVGAGVPLEYEERPIIITPGPNEYSFDLPIGIVKGDYKFSAQTYAESSAFTCLQNGKPSCLVKSNQTAITKFIAKEFSVGIKAPEASQFPQEPPPTQPSTPPPVITPPQNNTFKLSNYLPINPMIIILSGLGIFYLFLKRKK